ncbi:WD40 domain-containing protein [Leptolyngbya sp. NIES-2104]|uniref:WD40 domain-containing protein n=1 Tax=Leptolyngbya sp. NIES-2104 TaxID=1552121 RepID=UPI0006EC9EF6|nr:caspase family protein [Leptolyngbya sp. NIES-2104]GAP95452.1 high-affnity carbon uptake protein Hat/HatR [Leptolyngbya sp. NIES-2104]
MQSTLKTGQAKLWVLLVGVSQYADRRFPILQYSTIDAQRLSDAFADATQEFPNTSVQVYHDQATVPTLEAVRSGLEAIVNQAKPDDTVVFYFCGHGSIDSRLQQAVFCLADTQKDAMLQTGLSAIKLLGMLGSCAAKQQILWIDVCHANGMTAQSETPELLDSPVEQLSQMFRHSASQNSGFHALLSCDTPSGKGRQQSWKFPELGHGIFSHFLIEGLRGAAANPQGVVTASVLANYVHDRTIQYIDRTNQQLSWLHRDTDDRPSKAITQTPSRIGQAQSQIVLGIKPQDPLELLFPNIKATNIDPPLDRSASLVKPKPEIVIPAPIEKPSSIEPAIPILQKIVLEPIAPKVEEPAIQAKSFVEEASKDAPETISPTPEELLIRFEQAESSFEESAIEQHPEPVLPKVEEPAIHFEQSEESSIEPEPISPTAEELLVQFQKADLPAVEPVIQFEQTEEPAEPHVIESSIPTVGEVIPLAIQPSEVAKVEPQETVSEVATPFKQEHISEPIVAPVQNPVSETAIPPVREVTSKPAPRPIAKPAKPNQTQEQIKRLQTATQKQLKQTANTIAQATQAAGSFATAKHAQSKQRVAQLQNTITTKLGEFNQSIHHAANSGQAIYRQRTTEASQIAANTVQQVDRSTRNLTQSAVEHTQKPETRQLITAGLKILGVVAVAVTGVGLYQSRNEQIQAVQKLSSAATTQIESSQPGALSTALKAGHKLQQIDRPWNFVPETLKLSTTTTLQQAIVLFEQPTTPVGVSLSNASMSPDHKTFAVSTRDNTIQLWQRNGEKFQQLASFKGHQGTITQLAFSPDGKRLASASQDKTIKLWNVEKGILIQTLSAHTQAVTALSFRSDGEVLASGSADQTIKLWSVSQGRILDTFKGHNATANVIRFSPDGRILAAGMIDNSIHLWYPDSQNPVLLGNHDSQSEKIQGINDLAFAPDGKTIASAGSDDTIKLWTVGDANSERETIPNQTLSGHENTVTSLSFSADGKVLASAGRDRTIRLWNMQDGTFLKTLLGSQEPIEHVSFAGNDKALFSVGNRYGLKDWNLDLDSLMRSGCRLMGDSPPPECL